MTGFRFNEEYLSQILALQELIALGYEYLSPERASAIRGGKNGNLLLESVLREQLKKFNRIHYKGNDYHFSEANIREAIQR
ncbi:MAG: type I restriction endonuclease [Chlamydiota bacterium]